ncbi:unnamed protein product [Orchesella dallaii]|uniref:Uncharacterized protein n=1 Tax=Orchesella dallaii TaxID=48710 RepID=A0ABP1R205_9HEXA
MAGVLLPFLLELICAVIALQHFSTMFAQSVDHLDLNSQLEIFKKCSVNLVVNHAHLDQEDEFIGSYEIVPFNFPVILSYIRYIKPTKKKGSRGNGFHCGNQKMNLVPNQGFYFFAPPPPKSYCFVQVYIAPKSCLEEWRHNVRLPINQKRFHALLPDSFLNPIFDLRTTMRAKDAEDFSLEKANLIFIHVHRKPFEWIFYLGTIFSLVDSLFSYPYENRVNGALPTKILFEVERSSKEGLSIVTSASVFTCSDYKKIHNVFFKNCIKMRKEHTSKDACLSLAKLFWWEAPELVTYSNLKGIITSWKQLEAYRSKCRQNILVTRLVHTAVTTGELYLSDLTNQIKADNGSIQVEPFLVLMLCSNCTIISYMQSQVAESKIFPTFDLVVSPFPSTQFSVTTDSNHVHFITCSSLEKEDYLSLLGYVSAFDVGTWITAFVASVISGRLWYRYAKMPIFKVNRNRDKWFHAFFVYHVLLAQGTSAISKMRWITGSWIMTGIVLTFFYQGDNINRLMAPLSKSKLQSFDEMLAENLTIYSPFADTDLLKADYFEILNAGVNATILEWEASGAYNSSDTMELRTVFGAMYSRNHVRNTYKEISIILSRITRTPHMLATAIPTLDFDYFVNKISKCDKYVYVDTLGKVERMKLQLRKHRISGKRTTVSNHAYGQMFNEWMFRENPWPPEAFALKLHSLFQSGIVQLWRTWKFRVETWTDAVQLARNTTNLPKPVSISDNIVVVFYVHVLLLCVACVTFMFEARVVHQNLLKVWLHIHGSFIQLITGSLNWVSGTKLYRWLQYMKK